MQGDILFGHHAVVEALVGGLRPVHEIWATPERLKEIQSLLKGDIVVHAVDVAGLRKIVPQLQHQGIAARVDPFRYSAYDVVIERALREPRGAFLVILDQIQDPHNLGALIRTAHCVGAHGLLLSKDRAASVTPAVCRAAAGATEHLPIVQVTNIVQTIKLLKSHYIWVVGAEGESSQSLYDYRFDGGHAIVLGAEGKGLRRLVREACDLLLAIPLQGRIGSYNVSVAGAMILGEVMRQRIPQKSV